MPSTFFGVNIAKSGMSTYNAWLNTTGHNIANVKTEGYSRQYVNQKATEAVSLRTSYGMLGSGVDAININSQRDIYYDNKYRMSNAEFGKYETFSIHMQDIEDYLYAKDANDGAITNAMDLFLTEITELSKNVQDSSIRKQAVQYADLLLNYINEAADNLKAKQQDLNGQIADTVDMINAYAQEIASLTQQINTLEVYGSRANDLRDERATILDKLSELADVTVVEKEPFGGKGIVQYIVSVDNAVLVDTYDVNLLHYESRKTYNAMGDIDNLYDLRWSSGQDFGIHDKGLGGKLQALFELRDGNNGEIFEGKIKTTATAGSDVITVTDVNELGSSLFKLEIPSEHGIITVGHAEYEYKYFDCDVNDDGEFEYTFYLEKPLGFDANAGDDMHVSDAVDYRGIPYYLSQLDEFVRKFSYYFNELQTSGYDAYNATASERASETGNQMFISTDKVSGKEQNFSSDVYKSFSFNSQTGSVTNSTSAAELAGKNQRLGRDGDYDITTYYKMTAATASIDSKILWDGNLLACSDTYNGGISNGDNLLRMSALRDDKTMFLEGEPASFLKVLTSTVGIDSKKSDNNAGNAKNIKDSVQSRRLSKSGVDEDEEGQNLIICQNLLNYQYKVLSVMNEVLDKLINGTAL